MQTFNLGLWLPILSMVLGLIIHSLTADGAASLLARIGVVGRVPAQAIPPLVLLVGAGAGVVDALIGGADLQHAIASALTSTIMALGGVAAHHMVTAGVPSNDNGSPPEPASAPAAPPVETKAAA
jgi:hypothetical protein